jgi:ammonia channel protein AmtB
MPEIKEMVEHGSITTEDVSCLKAFAIEEFKNPNTDLEEESSMWMGIGTLVLWLGWFFFNGGSAYTLYNKAVNPAKII